jgi:hypothetical protein
MPAARCAESAGGVSLRGWLTRKRNKRGAIVVGVVAATVFAILDAYTVLRSDGSTDY